MANNLESIEIFQDEYGGHRVVHNFKREPSRSPVKLILWMLILFWAAILLLNIRAVQAIQEWIFSVRSVYIIMLLPSLLSVSLNV